MPASAVRIACLSKLGGVSFDCPAVAGGVAIPAGVGALLVDVLAIGIAPATVEAV